MNIREQSDRFVIEDCLCGDENQWKRRLRFQANPNLIQSEINLTGKDRKLHRVQKSIDSFFVLVQPDYSILENDYHGVIVTCLKNHFLAQSNSSMREERSRYVLILHRKCSTERQLAVDWFGWWCIDDEINSGIS